MPGWDGRGSTRAWRKTRAMILDRDGHTCRVHAEGWCSGAPAHQCERVATHVHHLDGRERGDDPRRLRASCPPCNLAIGDPTTSDPKPSPRTRW
jgi:5-methylcytosine-specific restriction endonuclease McrA